MSKRDETPMELVDSNGEATDHPVVFISYSHDSSAHKKWVGDLAGRLMEKGVDVILDQWDLEPGDDVPKFMEQSVRRANKVLIICTDAYVRKADDGKGGVGYESMIVTGELVQNLGTSKFIPVIRQAEGHTAKPASVSTRLHINLSEGQDIEEQFTSLLKAVHKMVRSTKPPLGANPFSTTSTAVPPLRDMKVSVDNISDLFNDALEIARRQDLIAWRRLSTKARGGLPEKLSEWRNRYERQGLTPRNPNEQERSKLFSILMDNVAEGVGIYQPLFAISLAGVISGDPKFNNQRAVLDDFIHPRGWNHSGSTDIADMPLTIAFVYQALHGAICLYSDQLSLAVRLARERVTTGYGRDANRLFEEERIVGWPPSLGRDSKLGWEFLWNLPDRWTWLLEAFGDADEYRVSLCSYYMGLTLLELVEVIESGHQELLDKKDVGIGVPIRFPAMEKDIVRRAYRRFLNSPDQVMEIWRSRDITEKSVKAVWPKWIALTSHLVRKEYWPDDSIFMAHENLFDDV